MLLSAVVPVALTMVALRVYRPAARVTLVLSQVQVPLAAGVAKPVVSS